MKCVVFGQSHQLALAMASREPESICKTQQKLSFEFLRIEPSAKPDLSETMSKLNEILIKDPAPTLIVALLGGNEHNVRGMLAQWPPYDFLVPGLDDAPLDRTVTLLPYEAVRATLRSDMQPWLEILEQVSLLPHPISYLQPPPPIPSASHIHMHLDPGFGVIPGPEAISPALLRLKLWSCMDEITRAECRRLGVLHLRVPAQAVDENGYLSARAWWVDATHANEWYGEQCLRHLFEIALTALSPASSHVVG